MYLAFSNIMTHLRDGFLRELANEAYGMGGHIANFDNILRASDEAVWVTLVLDAQVTHQFYSLRWFMLLMCQECDLASTIRLWDGLLAAEGPRIEKDDFADEVESPAMPKPEDRLRRFTYIDFVGVCLVKNIRSRIIQSEGDFAECMESLQ